MNPIVNALLGNWKSTLLGAAGALALYFQGQQGTVWNVVGAVAVLLLGAVSKDATTGSQAKPPAP